MQRKAHVSVFYRTATSCNSWTACLTLPENDDAAYEYVKKMLYKARRRAVKIDRVDIVYA